VIRGRWLRGRGQLGRRKKAKSNEYEKLRGEDMKITRIVI
jgi:hypothetical protein